MPILPTNIALGLNLADLNAIVNPGDIKLFSEQITKSFTDNLSLGIVNVSGAVVTIYPLIVDPNNIELSKQQFLDVFEKTSENNDIEEFAKDFAKVIVDCIERCFITAIPSGQKIYPSVTNQPILEQQVRQAIASVSSTNIPNLYNTIIASAMVLSTITSIVSIPPGSVLIPSTPSPIPNPNPLFGIIS